MEIDESRADPTHDAVPLGRPDGEDAGRVSARGGRGQAPRPEGRESPAEGGRVQARDPGKRALKPRSATAANLVFLNVPFDKEYERLYVALIAGLVRLGLRPRCVLEIPTQENRLRRIFKLIQSCGSSIHDLSRIELSDGHPRFNMPFEAGLGVAWGQIAGKRHRWFLLEKENYRLQRTLSDLNGFEVFTHGGTVKTLMAALPNMFLRSEAPAVAELVACAGNLIATAYNLKREMGKDDLFQPVAFRKVALAAAELADLSRLGLLPPWPEDEPL